jgi:calcineurin-like phosphoesterase family protein
MNHWYTADLHLGHDSIVPNAKRPFRDVAHMDAVLIERLWAKVAPDDNLWIVGDFAFGPQAKDEAWLLAMFGQLPGARKHLVVGNHDSPLTQALPWDSVSWMIEVDDPDADRPVTLCHYPMMTWNHARKGALHLFGHTHGNWRGSANAVNVGVDVWDYGPVTFREAEQRAKGLPPNRHWKDVEPRA